MIRLISVLIRKLQICLNQAAGVIGRETDITIRRKFSNQKKVDFHGVLPDMISFYLGLGVNYESDVRNFINMLSAKNNQCFVDIGAHFGYHTQQAALLFRNVVAVEPTPSTKRVLSTNISQFENVDVFGCAISDKNGRIALKDFGTQYSGWNTVEKISRIAGPFQIGLKSKINEVQAYSLDSFIKINKLEPNVVKIDVENHEISVLRGAEKTLDNFKPAIILEAGDRGRTEKQSTRSCLNLLDDHSYTFFQQGRKGQIVTLETRVNYGKLNILCIHKDKLKNYPQLSPFDL